MVKAELIKLVETVNVGGGTCRMDSLASAAGQTVVRLPPYHCQLNSIELMWSGVKGFAASRNTTFKLEDVEPLVQGTAEKWKNLCQARH